MPAFEPGRGQKKRFRYFRAHPNPNSESRGPGFARTACTRRPGAQGLPGVTRTALHPVPRRTEAARPPRVTSHAALHSAPNGASPPSLAAGVCHVPPTSLSVAPPPIRPHPAEGLSGSQSPPAQGEGGVGTQGPKGIAIGCGRWCEIWQHPGQRSEVSDGVLHRLDLLPPPLASRRGEVPAAFVSKVPAEVAHFLRLLVGLWYPTR